MPANKAGILSSLGRPSSVADGLGFEIWIRIILVKLVRYASPYDTAFDDNEALAAIIPPQVGPSAYTGTVTTEGIDLPSGNPDRIEGSVRRDFASPMVVTSHT